MTADEVVSYLLEDEGADFLRESLKWVVQQLMEAEVCDLVGAEHGERSEDRLTHRNGYRGRRWDTRAGEIELAIPKLRRGSYFPTFLEPRKRSEQALVAVAQEAYVAGVSTRKVDQVVESLGLRVSKSEVSRVCRGLDEQVEAFRGRPLEGRYPYLWLDAKVEKVRAGGCVQRKRLVIAHAVHESGRREVIGLDVGECETEAFWTEFLRGLVSRGLTGVQLCVSDAHQGLKAAIAKVLGVPWQRCTVHFLRDCLGHARQEQQPMLGALVRPIFNRDDREQARSPLGGGRPPRGQAAQGRHTARGGRGGRAHLLRLPGRPSAQDPLDQPARAGKPRDRQAHRRGRHLPQRPGAAAARDQPRHRAERRVARRAPLPVGPRDGAAPRGAAPSHSRGGAAARSGLSNQRPYRRSLTPRPGT
jgi:transposase-like protein